MPMKTSNGRKLYVSQTKPKITFADDGLLPSGAVYDTLSKEAEPNTVFKLELTGESREIQPGDMYAIGEVVHVASFVGGSFQIVRAVVV